MWYYPEAVFFFFLKHPNKRKTIFSLFYSHLFPYIWSIVNYFWAQRMWNWHCHKSALLQNHRKPHVCTHAHTHAHSPLFLPLLFYHFHFQLKLKCDIDEKQSSSRYAFVTSRLTMDRYPSTVLLCFAILGCFLFTEKFYML